MPFRLAAALALASAGLWAAALAHASSEAAGSPGGLVVAPSLRELLLALVTERSGADPRDVEIPSLNDFRLPADAAARAQVELSVHSSEDFRGPTPITVVIREGEQELRRGVVTVRVRRPQRVLVAARRLDRGAVVSESDLGWREVPEGQVLADAVDDPQQLLGRTTARGISAGTAWRPEFVADAPLVARGELVRIRIESGALRIDALGLARADGRPGQRLRVLNPDSHRELVGTLASDGVVHVSY